MDPEIIFSLVYIVVAICFVLSPREFETAGLTVQRLFSSYLGSEDFDFIRYHLKRTAVTVIVHSCIPIGYYIGLGFASDRLNLFNLARAGQFASVLLLISISSALCGLLIARTWSWDNWKYHPLCQDLAKHGGTWMAVAAQINIEFRRIEKFSAIVAGSGIYVTDSWILKTSAYRVHVAQQTDSHLSIAGSDHFAVSHETNQPTQYLSIIVHSITPGIKSFTLRLNSMDYTEMKDRLQAPIRNARNIVIHQSLSDKFLDAFKIQVHSNARYRMRGDVTELEPCIGCMQKTSDVKLQKRCAPSGDGECRECYCRPMWCMDCMGKWFASRQDQADPTTWMSSISPCPTCRSKFCMLDVSLIER